MYVFEGIFADNYNKFLTCEDDDNISTEEYTQLTQFLKTLQKDKNGMVSIDYGKTDEAKFFEIGNHQLIYIHLMWIIVILLCSECKLFSHYRRGHTRRERKVIFFWGYFLMPILMAGLLIACYVQYQNALEFVKLADQE